MLVSPNKLWKNGNNMSKKTVSRGLCCSSRSLLKTGQRNLFRPPVISRKFEKLKAISQRNEHSANGQSAAIINGRVLAKEIYRDIRQGIADFRETHSRSPGLAVVHVRHRHESVIYTRLKRRRAERLGIHSVGVELNSDCSAEDVKASIARLNADPLVDGILLQLPLPPALAPLQSALIECIDSRKDVDGLTAANCGHLLQNWGAATFERLFARDDATAVGNYRNYPCTALAVVHLLKHIETMSLPYFSDVIFDSTKKASLSSSSSFSSCSELSGGSIRISGSRILVIGRSLLVGKPIATMLSGLNATVTLCHTYTGAAQLKALCQQSDIIVTATGDPHLIASADFLADARRTVVIDVGSTVVGEELFGDVRFDAVAKSKRCAAITPVPGGVGPLTVAFLMKNTLHSAIHRELLSDVSLSSF